MHFFSQESDIQWIRLHYLFPDKRIFKLLDLFEKYPKLVSYLDIPFQHVSESVLSEMRRPSDITLFHDILEKWRQIRPQGSVRTSFIMGFPNESEDDVEKLCTFLEEHPIDKLSLFAYSHEEGTRAYDNLDDVIPDEVKTERINRVREFHLNQRKNRREYLIGTIEKMLVEKVDYSDSGFDTSPE